MKGFSRILFGATIVSLLPVVAGAAGTYYNGNLYQNPQARYGAMTGNGGGFYNNYGGGRGYGQNMVMQSMGTSKNTTTNAQTTRMTTTKQATSQSQKQGFRLGVDVEHEFANWNFEMNQTGSKLHYDNLRWNIVNGEAAYYFGGSTPMQIKIGGRYGVQYDESSMNDDDISNGGTWFFYSDGSTQRGTPSLSVGTSKDGTQYGFNASFGLTDFLNLGHVKITPSIGYRYFKYKVKTKNNNGLRIDIINNQATLVNCLDRDGEILCEPFIGFVNSSGDIVGYGHLATDTDGAFILDNTNSYVVENVDQPYINVGNTYYYEQPGVSHSYETEWAGPYIALDMEYQINNDNFVNAGLEFGLPIYESKGDQPYRIDWVHPNSIEDKGDFGDAIHLGFNAMWSTALSDSVMLSLGMTYDYYRVKDVDAKTHLSAAWYEPDYEVLVSEYNAVKVAYDAAVAGGSLDQDLADEMAYYSAELAEWSAIRAAGWTTELKNEIESVYKSMGIRLGLNVKF